MSKAVFPTKESARNLRPMTATWVTLGLLCYRSMILNALQVNVPRTFCAMILRDGSLRQLKVHFFAAKRMINVSFSVIAEMVWSCCVCCVASVTSEQQHNQDWRRIYLVYTTQVNSAFGVADWLARRWFTKYYQKNLPQHCCPLDNPISHVWSYTIKMNL